MTELQARLSALAEPDFAAFQAKLLPTVERGRILGVCTPALRRMAGELWQSGAAESFLEALPHEYFEENQLHAFLLSQMRDFDALLPRLERFLPYVDNWATCDQLRPSIFSKHRERLLPYIEPWLAAEPCYTVRFGLGMLLAHYLDGAFCADYLAMAAALRREEYYIRMMQAWYFATALAKQYEAALPILTERRLDPWTHNKSIQKACESRRLSSEQKAFLKTLKRQ